MQCCSFAQVKNLWPKTLCLKDSCQVPSLIMIHLFHHTFKPTDITIVITLYWVEVLREYGLMKTLAHTFSSLRFSALSIMALWSVLTKTENSGVCEPHNPT